MFYCSITIFYNIINLLYRCTFLLDDAEESRDLCNHGCIRCIWKKLRLLETINNIKILYCACTHVWWPPMYIPHEFKKGSWYRKHVPIYSNNIFNTILIYVLLKFLLTIWQYFLKNCILIVYTSITGFLDLFIFFFNTIFYSLYITITNFLYFALLLKTSICSCHDYKWLSLIILILTNTKHTFFIQILWFKYEKSYTVSKSSQEQHFLVLI